MEEERRFGLNNLKSKKKMGWGIASFMIFLGCMQFIKHAHLSGNTTMFLIIGLTGLYITGTIIFGWVLRTNYKLMLERAMQAQETINLKLRSIRSQLNPHFMFNALTSIQNLMNKNDIAGANHYLAMFADLTRKVLNTSDQELISLEDELHIQEDYLQMEQLRFGFRYKVKVDESINIANTQIPAMLLQPFVENAVKHGVAPLQQKGMIQVQIVKQGNDLVLSVIDNGKGFDKNLVQNQNSLGLKLSTERIALLNQLHKDQPVTLNIDPKPGCTTITIILVNLLA
jgi:sensor histidine kinase YesM